MSKKQTPRATPQKGPRPGRTGRLIRYAAILALAIGLGAAWWWQHTLLVQTVEVTGTVHADPTDIIQRTGIRPDSDAVFSLSPALVADRAERSPWVETAAVRRLPSGAVALRVTERVPVVLVMRGGRAAGYFDATGVMLPLTADSVAYDLPLLTGSVPDVEPGKRTTSLALRETLTALATADDGVDALISEVEWRRGLGVVWTTPAGGQPSIAVRLGATDVADQLLRLRAFWDQSVLPRPQTRFRTVDLHFRGQVITQEGAPLAPDSTRAAAPRTASSSSVTSPPDAG